jgi:hypothetical protein
MTRLMTSPVRAKMQISSQKLVESQNSKTSAVSKTALMMGTTSVVETSTSSW